MRYINLGGVTAPEYALAREYDRILPLDGPTFVTGHAKRRMLLVINDAPLADHVHVERLPADMYVCRQVIPGAGPDAYGVTLHAPDANVGIGVYLPKHRREAARKLVMAAMTRLMRGYDVTVLVQGNDLYMQAEPYPRKFAGFSISQRGGWTVVGGVVAVEFETELANQVYRFDAPKFASKGITGNLERFVGGLRDVVPDLTPQVLEDGFAAALADRLGAEIDARGLTPEERALVDAEIARYQAR